MKKIIGLILSILLMITCFAGCTTPPKAPDDKAPETPTTGSDKLLTDKASIDYGFNKLFGDNALNDSINGFESKGDITGARFLVNGEYASVFKTFSSRNDVKMEFYNGESAMIVNASGGSAFVIPATDKLSIDYSLAKYRTKIITSDSILTVSAESSNPYASAPNPWTTYRDEWLLRWINNDDYITKNKLERVSPVVYSDLSVNSGFDVYMYSVKILEGENIEHPFYNIGVIRAKDDNINFSLFVMKSKTDKTTEMTNIIKSYKRLTSKGVSKNYYDAGEPKENKTWSAETKAYYQQLQTTKTVGWGAFSYSMPGIDSGLVPGQPGYDSYLEKSMRMRDGIEDIWEHDFDIYPTYTHISWHKDKHSFPTAMATELAGGNGTNGKPVLQFTYQFTTNNNNVADNTTPMFDILRGNFDEQFTKLARDMKAYGKPILFRLNNEMNTDWTSYCGMLTLLDPDVFVMTWKYLYNIFEKEGVDNAIWIWNPIEESCPYSSWGEDLCYNPGADYVQLLGITSYEMNNNAAKTESFETRYQRLYKKNSVAWSKYRAIISEFACGSGGDVTGELGRNRELQAKWITDMFDCFYGENPKPFAQQIVGGVWFNCNDYVGKQISNRLRVFDPDSNDYNDLTSTIDAFKKGMKIRR